MHMSKLKFNRRKPSAAARVFTQEYTPFIQDKVINYYGPSYSSVADFGNAWRTKITWSQEIEDYAIFQSRLFIIMLDSKSSNSTNPQFLKALTQMMAEYLAKFSIQAPNPPTRKSATEKIENLLFHKNNHIQNILAAQKAVRGK